MALSANDAGVKDGLGAYFALYGQPIVGRKLSQSQYCTSLEG